MSATYIERQVRQMHRDEVTYRRELGNVPTSRSEYDAMVDQIHHIAKRDNEADKRVKVHIVYIVIGIIITSATPLVPALIPFVGILGGIPTIAQEITDWVRHW